MPTFKEKSEVDDTRVKSRRDDDLGPKTGWNFRLTTSDIGFPDPDMPLTWPEFVRLPRAGQRCPLTGLSRSAINTLVLPTAENHFQPPVRSFVLRRLALPSHF